MARNRKSGDASSGTRNQWLDVFRSLGDALLDVLRAEVALVLEHWKVWGKSMAIAVALLACALFLAFWVGGFLAVAAVHGLMDILDWKLWQAALLIAGTLVLLMALLGLIAYVLARRAGNPVVVTQERFGEHQAWFSETILGEPRLPAGEKHDGSTDATDAASDGAAGEPPPDR